jgi:cytolysin (calcineurin-like family phosphatase)
MLVSAAAAQTREQPEPPQVPEWMPAHARYLIVTADPQYPWAPDRRDEAAYSRQLISEQYRSINRFVLGKNVIGTFINGDLTAFGHDWQVNYMIGALNTLKTPVYLGLGNHDIENNVDDCSENNCIRRSVWWFADHMSRMQPDAFDITFGNYYQFPTNHEEVRGSLAWAKTFDDDLVVIQLNNYPHYTTWASGFASARALTEVVNIKSSLPWFERQLWQARREGKAIIVMMHQPTWNEEFLQLIERYEVSALMVGHLHDGVGRGGMLRGVPMLMSGSSEFRSYLIMQRWGRKLNVYKVEQNRPEARTFTAFVSLKQPRKDIPPATTIKAFDVRIHNQGGYQGSYRLSYRAGGGPDQHHDVYLHLGQAHTYRVPANASGVRLESWTNTGVLWNMWNKFIDMPLTPGIDACVSTWGTTWHPAWGHC